MGTKTKVVLLAALFMMSAFVISFQQADLSADSGFSVEDGQGTVIEYDEPSNKVMTIGKGLTATVIELGYLSKIVVCDKYSYTATEDVFNELKALVDNGDIAASGTIYSAGKTDLINSIVDAADTTNGGTFDKEKDTILLTGSATYLNSIVNDLKGYGFERMLVWNDITTYDDLIDYAEVVSKVVSGGISDLVEQMKYVPKNISETLESKGISDSERTKAFYITYSGGVFKAGNTGSLAASMIAAAGGNVVTIDPEKASPTYEVNVTELIETHGTNTVIFVDASIAGSETNTNKLNGLISADVKVVPLESLWNNFDPDSMTGVWTMACAMYPDLFTGDVPSLPSGDDPDWVLYISVAAVVIVMIGIAAYFLMRRS